jgi:hypothetical protein
MPFSPHIYRSALPVHDFTIIRALTTHWELEALPQLNATCVAHKPCELNRRWLSEQSNPSSYCEQLDCLPRSPRELLVGTEISREDG